LIACRVPVPVGAVDLDANLGVFKNKIDAIAPHFYFLPEPNTERSERRSDCRFNGSLSRETAVAGNGAKTSILARTNPLGLIAINARRVLGWTSTLFRTVRSMQVAPHVGRFMWKLLTAPLARNVDGSKRPSLALDRAEVISGFNGGVDRKAALASYADLGRFIFSRGLIANTTAKNAVRNTFRSLRLLAACRTNHRDFVFTFGNKVAALRTKTVCRITFWLDHLGAQLKRPRALRACEIKRHLCLTATRMLLFYRIYSATKPTVYDITVEGAPEFFANGVLVHNCELCAPLDRKVFTIEQARGMIPRHPNCRCSFIPVVKSQNAVA